MDMELKGYDTPDREEVEKSELTVNPEEPEEEAPKKPSRVMLRDGYAYMNSLDPKMRDRELHHKHPVVKDPDGTLRWEADPALDILSEKFSMNDIWRIWYEAGLDKNTEGIRHFYRCMGYSLFGYWEIFHWEVNNPKADEYQPPERRKVSDFFGSIY